MKNIFKQFAEWATPSNQNRFRKATILLTAYYMAGVFVVLIIFNLMVYILFTNNIRTNNNENQGYTLLEENQSEKGEDRVKELQDNLARVLLISDSLILILSLIVAYASSRKTLLPLEIAYKKQERFVADAAHELRTPLSVIKAGSEVILRHTRKEEEYIKFIIESLEEVERLTALSNDLLFLAHNDNKKNNTNDKVLLTELCRRQLDIMKVYADSKNISIKDSIENNIVLSGNKNDITRLIINLIKNAIDYNKKNGQVNVTLKKQGDKIIMTIEDSGIGIGQDDLALIFERFYKADNSRTQNSSGTGLGLSIVKEIVDEHNGSIKIDSAVGQGTIIKVIFPRG